MKTINGFSINFDFSKLIKVADLIYHDGPLLSHYVSNKGENYLFYWVDVDNEYNRWVVIRTDIFSIQQYLEKKSTLHSIITQPNDGFVYTVDIDDIITLAFAIPNKAKAVISIGGGKVIDAGKYAAFLRNLPFISVPTSSSSDGFSSASASLLVQGKRTSVPARLAYGIIVDTQVIRTAPEKFIYSGIVDMISKITALYDWIFEERAGCGEVNDFAVMIAKKAVNSFVRTPYESIKDELFLKELLDSLAMSGIANEIAGSSAPTSGSEHLISHALDKILEVMPDDKPMALEEELPRIAVVGRPNAGKSSLVNAFIGEERNIVTDIAGTTRDSIYTKYNKFGLNFYLVDTAGIRKKGKVTEDLEYYSVIRSIRAIENADVCVLMLDATRGIESQDLNIFSLIQKNKKGLVVCVNKWDLIEDKSQKVINSYTTAIRERLAPFTDFPIIFISAMTKQRIFKVLETAKQVYENRQRRVSTAKLNETMLPIIENYPPPAWKGKYIKIKYVTQLPAGSIPSFVFFCNLPQWVKDPYKRFLENKIRDNWDFTGTPINIFIREK